MRQPRRRVFALAAVLALITSAAALVLASIGTAASGNICTNPTTSSNPYASCVTETVTPHFLSSSGGKALSLTVFKNQSGSGGATATHVLLKATFTPAVTVLSIGWSLNGSSLVNTGCALPGPNLGSISCQIGNVGGGGKAVLVVQFSTTSNESVGGNVQYGEGAAQPNSVPNDSQNAQPDSVQLSGTAGGGCDLTSNPGSASGGSSAQRTTANVPADTSLNLPCIPVDAGVKAKPANNPAFNTDVSFVEFPLVSTGPSSVKLFFTPLPTGLKKNFDLLEDANNDGIFEVPSVPPCNPQPNPIPAGSDSCIVTRTTLPKGGLEIDLLVNGASLDNQWHG